MVTNSAVLAALVLLLGVSWLAAETSFLAPYKRVLFQEHARLIAGLLFVLFVNLFALFYGLARLIFLKNTGVKLHHLDRQLSTRDTVLTGLSRHASD